MNVSLLEAICPSTQAHTWYGAYVFKYDLIIYPLSYPANKPNCCVLYLPRNKTLIPSWET